MYKSTRGGYVGLIALLVATALLAFIFVRVYLTPHPQTSAEEAEVQPPDASGTVPATDYARMHADIDAANAARKRMDQAEQEFNAALGE